MNQRRQLLCAAAVLLTPSVALAQAPAWPAKPVRIIVPTSPGGGTDQGIDRARAFEA